jgi:hypothetical protein
MLIGMNVGARSPLQIRIEEDDLCFAVRVTRETPAPDQDQVGICGEAARFIVQPWNNAMPWRHSFLSARMSRCR